MATTNVPATVSVPELQRAASRRILRRQMKKRQQSARKYAVAKRRRRKTGSESRRTDGLVREGSVEYVCRTSSPSNAFTVCDLFCGAGGLSAGFRLAGFRPVAGVDIDPDAIATYRQNFPEALAICGDIREKDIERRVHEVARHADIVVGGPPCQAFSQVRNHSRIIDDPRNSLYREFVRVLEIAKPHVFLMENVTGMDQMGVREQIAEDLALDGEYTVRSQVVDAVDFGVPQSRKRLLFLGCHRNLHVEPPVLQGTGASAALTLARRRIGARVIYRVEEQTPLLSRPLTRALTDSKDLSVVSVEKAISDLRNLPIGNRTDTIAYAQMPAPESAYQAIMRFGSNAELRNVQVPRINADTSLRLAHVPQGGNHRDLPESLLQRYLTGERWGQDNGSGRLSRRHFYAYRRLHPGIWAWTLNTKADSAYHYSVKRALSVREFARLQSFSDSFVFMTDLRKGPIVGRIDGGAAHSKYRQVGNAVPPLLASAAATAFRQILLGETMRAAASA